MNVTRIPYAQIGSRMGSSLRTGFSEAGESLDKNILQQRVAEFAKNFETLKQGVADDVAEVMNKTGYSQKQIEYTKTSILAMKDKEEFTFKTKDFFDMLQYYEKNKEYISEPPDYGIQKTTYFKYTEPGVTKAKEKVKTAEERRAVRSAIEGQTIPAQARQELPAEEQYGYEGRPIMAPPMTVTAPQTVEPAETRRDVYERTPGVSPEIREEEVKAAGIPSSLEAQKEARLQKTQQIKIKDMTDEQFNRDMKRREVELKERQQRLREQEAEVGPIEDALTYERRDLFQKHKSTVDEIKEIDDAISSEKSMPALDRDQTKILELEQRKKELEDHIKNIAGGIDFVGLKLRTLRKSGSYKKQSGTLVQTGGVGSTAEAMNYTKDELRSAAKWTAKGYTEDQIRAAIERMRKGEGQRVSQ